MTEIQANHICKNICCTKGDDGGRTHYYACDYCGKTQNWRSMACSMECYNEYMQQVTAARNTGSAVDTYPERTDMSHEAVVELVDKTPIENVKVATMEQLADYKKMITEHGLGETVDFINTKNKKKKR